MSSFDRHYARLGRGESDPCFRQYPEGVRTVSGSAAFDSLAASRIACSGSVLVNGELAARQLSVSGSLRAGTVSCCDARISGSAVVAGPASFGTLSVSGSMVIKEKVDCSVCESSGSIEAEEITTDSLEASGFIMAEEVKCTRFNLEGGGKVSIVRATDVRVNRSPHRIFLSFRRKDFEFKEIIATETAELSMAVGHLVAAKTVKLGRGCRVDLVYYVDDYEVEEGVSVGSANRVSSLDGIEDGNGS
ncbi:hypothetical protein [Tardisphaera saccharovorans]